MKPTTQSQHNQWIERNFAEHKLISGKIPQLYYITEPIKDFQS